MPSFTVEQDTKLSPDEAFAKVRQYLEESQGLRKLDSGIECTFDESAKSGHVKGSKFDCTMKVTQAGSTKVVFNVSIPLLLTPLKGTIQQTLKEKMVKILG